MHFAIAFYIPLFSLYLYNTDTTPAECSAGSRVELAVFDPSRQNKKTLLNQTTYRQVKELQDKELLCHLDVQSGKVIVAGEHEWVQILANALTKTVDSSVSYFVLTCLRIRKTLYD